MSRRNQRNQRGRKGNLEVSPRSRKRLRLRSRVPVVAILALGLLVVSFTWGLPRYQKYREISNQITALEERKQTMETERQRLIKEAEWLESDAAVEKIAREELGLVKPGERPLIDILGSR
ncbi:MAG: hypothetical protein HPY50_17800 [Firmicutes bacterium]|nr:hypothetical protein [Bacillota bacterium]